MSSCAEEELHPSVALTAEEREQLRVHKLREKKQQIASLASAVVSDPHGNVRHHRGLRLSSFTTALTRTFLLLFR